MCACKPCLKKERQADGNPVDAPAVGFVLCRGGCGVHVKASRVVCKPCAKVESEPLARNARGSSPAGASGRCQEACVRGGRCASRAYVYYLDGFGVLGGSGGPLGIVIHEPKVAGLVSAAVISSLVGGGDAH